jgi:hypothetical protein
MDVLRNLIGLFPKKLRDHALGSSGPAAAQARAQVLQELFPKYLPDQFARSFDASRLPGRANDMKLELCRMLVARGISADAVIELWKTIFDGERWWLDRISATHFAADAKQEGCGSSETKIL